LSGIAFKDVVVETVEGRYPAPTDKRQVTAFRGFRVGIGEGCEILW
jgi:hypothetical protein